MSDADCKENVGSVGIGVGEEKWLGKPMAAGRKGVKPRWCDHARQRQQLRFLLCAALF
jgi:hypothetical protein